MRHTDPKSTVEPEGPEAGLDRGGQFLRLVWTLDHELRSMSKRMEARYGVTGPQRFTLRMLGHAPGLGAGELAELLQLHPSTLTGILQRLEAGGLVRRTTDRKDTRRISLELTPAGRKVDTLHAGTVEAAVRRTLRKCSREQIDGARALLVALIAELRRDE
jgi:MarR family transcriptional regulator, organic hydroperoxide resistance regulator